MMDPEALDNVFHEDYVDEEASDSDDALSQSQEFDNQNVDNEELDDRLSISVEQAKANLAAAGTEVEEEVDRITVAGNPSLMNTEVDAILDDIVGKLGLPYKVAEFQRVAVNALGGLKNVILCSPTGSGKMNVALLATLVLRKRLENPKGVCIITQPLSSIMQEKKRNRVCEAAVLSMTGELTTSLDEDESSNLSCDLHDLLDGEYPVLFGHPESFDSKLGQHILKELQTRNRIILVCIDEFHQVSIQKFTYCPKI